MTFSLSSLHGLPECVDVDGVSYGIRSDFRVVLRALKMLGDPEIGRNEKPILLAKIFYTVKAPADPWPAFERFVRCGRDDAAGGGVRDFDYEDDAQEIYAAFWQVYGIDLIDVSELHWWKFTALLNGLSGSNALTAKIQLRHADDSEGERRSSLARAKNAVQLTEHVSKTDAAIQDKIIERLRHGEPIDDLIGGDTNA